MYRVCLLWASLPEIKTIDWLIGSLIHILTSSTHRHVYSAPTLFEGEFDGLRAQQVQHHSVDSSCIVQLQMKHLRKKTCCTVTETKFSLLTLQCSLYRMVWRGRRKVRRRRTRLSSQPALLQGYHFFKNKTSCIFYHGCHYHSANICF